MLGRKVHRREKVISSFINEFLIKGSVKRNSSEKANWSRNKKVEKPVSEFFFNAFHCL